MKKIYSLILTIVLMSVSFSQAEGKRNLAMSDLNARGLSEDEAQIIGERLRNEIVNQGDLRVMERSMMQALLKEQSFAQSGACDDDACQIKMGKMLGVDFLAVGSVGKLGSMYTINLRAMDVETGEIIKSFSLDQKGDIEDLLGEPLQNLAYKVVNALAPKTFSNTQPDTEKSFEQKQSSAKQAVADLNASSSGSGKLWARIGTGVGAALFAGGYFFYDSQIKTDNKKLDEYSLAYQTATTSDDAIKARKSYTDLKSKTEDKSTLRGLSLGLAGACLLGFGLTFAF